MLIYECMACVMGVQVAVTDHSGNRENQAALREAGDGSEPDARFTFANERTFLAWSRTALALVVAGLAVIQLLLSFPEFPRTGTSSGRR